MESRLQSRTAFGLVAAACSLLALSAEADSQFSTFEDSLATGIGVDWNPGNNASDLEFVEDGATEGSKALKITHNTNWSNALFFDGGAVAEVVSQSTAFEFDVTLDGFDTDWRQAFVVMQGAGLGWTQRGFDLDAGIGIEPFVTTPISVDLTDQYAAGAAASLGEDGWFQIYIIFQGNDLTGEPQVSTIVDNMRFIGGPDPLQGDYNNDGIVDAADYTVWRDGNSLDASETAYDAWLGNYGAASDGGGLSIPEPSALACVAVSLGLLGTRAYRV